MATSLISARRVSALIGPMGPQGLPGAPGVGGTPTLFFATLASTPAFSRTSVFLDGYAAPGDGGGGAFSWNATSTQTPDGGNVSAGPGGAGVPGRWVKTVSGRAEVNVRYYGAKGIGTDDTAAFLRARDAFQAVNKLGFGGRFFIPGGNYGLTGMIVFTGLNGGIIEGDGKFQSLLFELGGMQGMPAMIRLVNCNEVTVVGFEVTVAPWEATVTGPVTAGSTLTIPYSFINTTPIAGQYAVLRNVVAGVFEAGELVKIMTVTPGVSFTIATTTKYSYVSGDRICLGAFAGVAIHSDQTLPGAQHSTRNKIHNVMAGSAGFPCQLNGFAITVEGGGLALLASTANASQKVIDFVDASNMSPGDVLTVIDDEVLTNQEQLTIAPGGISGNTVTFTTNLVHTHTVSPSVKPAAFSTSDINNEEHLFLGCHSENVALAHFYAEGLNSLASNVIGSKGDGHGAAFCYGVRGGSFLVTACQWDLDPGCYAVQLGGNQQHPWMFAGCESEDASGLLMADAAWGATAVSVAFTNHDQKFGATGSTRNIDVTSANGLSVTVTGRQLGGLNGSAGGPLFFKEALGAGVASILQTDISTSALSVDGVQLLIGPGSTLPSGVTTTLATGGTVSYLNALIAGVQTTQYPVGAGIGFGALPAHAGLLRAPSNTPILNSRNAANNGDLTLISTDAADGAYFGASGSPAVYIGLGANDVRLYSNFVPGLHLSTDGLHMGSGIMGDSTTNPLFLTPGSVVLGHGGTTTLTAAQWATPYLALSDTGLTSNAIVAFPAGALKTGAFWTIDTTGIASFGAFHVTITINGNTWGTAITTAGLWEITCNGVKFFGNPLTA